MSNIASFSSGFFNSKNGDRLYNAEQMSRLFDGLIHDGIYAGVGGRFLVTADEDTDNSVLIDSGRAWFDHTWCLLESQIEYSGMIPAPPVSKYRYDAIVLDINHETRDNDILVVSGEEKSISGTVSAKDAATLAGSATVNPPRPTFANTSNHKQYPICYILRRPGVARILAADIVYMVGTTACPLVTGVVTSGNINDYISGWAAQWELFKNTYETGAETWMTDQQTDFNTWKNGQETDFTTWSTTQKNAFATWMAGEKTDFDTWFANLQYILDGDVAGHLQNEIDALNSKTTGMDSGYVRVGKKNNSLVGNRSTAEGYETAAKSEYSHAEGYGTIADGSCGHVEGNNTKTTGNYSHAEGNGTYARGLTSHAEGRDTTASGTRSHAEGDGTTASGESSHAEGLRTTASGGESHAEGYETIASGMGSHTEGHKTTASGKNSHAEGQSTTASNDGSHAEGKSTTASGKYSHAGGYSVTASNEASFVYGYKDTLSNSNIFGFGGKSLEVNIANDTEIDSKYGASVYSRVPHGTYTNYSHGIFINIGCDAGTYLLICNIWRNLDDNDRRYSLYSSECDIIVNNSRASNLEQIINIGSYGTVDNYIRKEKISDLESKNIIKIIPKVGEIEIEVNLIRLS